MSFATSLWCECACCRCSGLVRQIKKWIATTTPSWIENWVVYWITVRRLLQLEYFYLLPFSLADESNIFALLIVGMNSTQKSDSFATASHFSLRQPSKTTWNFTHSLPNSRRLDWSREQLFRLIADCVAPYAREDIMSSHWHTPRTVCDLHWNKVVHVEGDQNVQIKVALHSESEHGILRPGDCSVGITNT